MTDHDLNKLLAETAGVKVFETGQNFNCIWNMQPDPDEGEYFFAACETWTPLTDHNQMALVKAGLREQDISHSSTWEDLSYYVVCLDWVVGDESQEVFHKDTDELRAFAEAVAKMKGSE